MGVVARDLKTGNIYPRLIARKKREDIFDVMFNLCGELENIAMVHRPVFGVIEYPASKFQAKDVFEIAGLARGKMFYSSRGECKLMFVQTMSARKALTGRGDGDKEEFLERFAFHHGHKIPGDDIYADDNVLEALGLAMLAEDLYYGGKQLLTKHSITRPEKLIEIARFLMYGGKKPKAAKKGKRLII